ncbi:MAG: carboxypeptidase regulatory-like domain-containing protein [Bryobacterales bacterium]|nr:carboxypeptidase regulatory-like domain-containing protein [Bryobacterales bacterium]
MRARTILIAASIAAMASAIAVVLIIKVRHSSVSLIGVVLRQDSDPRKQLPIPAVKITATEGEREVAGESDASGLFQLQLPNGGWRERPVTLTFRHPDYQPLEIAPHVDGQLLLVRMRPVAIPAAVPVSLHDVAVKDVRVRYAEQSSSTVNVGSTAKTFEVPNTGNVPCGDNPPCSPDGKWKAAVGGIILDAGVGQEFTNARVSCISGPCPFTRIEAGAVPRPGRTITVRVRDWSDTVTFLVEAEVTRAMPSDAIRQAYPAIYGRSMSFTLPATAEGPSIEADLGGSEIVFPLGPALQLSWAECSRQVGTDQTKLYRCELKPGYDFR